MSGRKRKQTKQLTLACWKKFKVEVEHRGEKVEAKLKTVASSKPKVTCDICKKEFLNNQGLGCHKLKCEKKKWNVVYHFATTACSINKGSFVHRKRRQDGFRMRHR